MPENPKSPRDQFVDDILDAALRNYSRAEPLSGLENRVLRRLHENPPKSSWLTGWHWTAMGAVGTLAVVALALITYPPEVNRFVSPQTKQDVAPGDANRVGPGAAGVANPLARSGAVQQRSAPAAVTVPPANRTPRFNKTIQQSGVRPGGTSGIRPQTLPPCTPEQEANLKKKQAEHKDQAKTPPDCAPESSQQHPSQTRPPRH